MFIVGMAMVVLGYTLLYYGVGLWNYYRINGGHASIPPNTISYLLGFQSNGDTPKLPFDESTSGTSTGANPTTPAPSSGGQSGVQSV